MQFRRGGLLVATLSAVLYVGLVLAQYLTASGLLHDPWLGRRRSSLPPRSVGAVHRRAERVRLLRRGAAQRIARRTACGRPARGSSRRRREIADLQALNQHVIDSLPSGLATTDTRAADPDVQPRRRGHHRRCRSASVVGRPIDEVLQLPPPAARRARPTSSTAPRARRVEFRYRTADGRGEIEIGLSATHLETPGGRAGLLFTFQDVTDIKKLERDARIQQRLAAVGEMAAGIAHEIRNPLASMSGSIQILRQELPLSSEQEQLMDIVLRESERLNTTIRSFLAYARPQRFAIARFDVRRALNDTALLLRNSAEVHEGHVDRRRRAGRPSSGTRPTKGRSSRSSGTWRPTACARCPTADACGSIGARRAGVGRRRDHRAATRASAFRPRSSTACSSRSTARFAKGSGLGLAIVHRIVTDYNGEIQVSSQPGAGTTVSVRLPARAVVTT